MIKIIGFLFAKDHEYGLKEIRIDDMLEALDAVRMKYGNNPVVSIHHTDSVAYLNSLPDKSRDIIYIDGDHSEEGCYRDLVAALPKARTYLCGHDYHCGCGGVDMAVDRFLKENGLQLSHVTDEWAKSFCVSL